MKKQIIFGYSPRAQLKHLIWQEAEGNFKSEREEGSSLLPLRLILLAG